MFPVEAVYYVYQQVARGECTSVFFYFGLSRLGSILIVVLTTPTVDAVYSWSRKFQVILYREQEANGLLQGQANTSDVSG